MIRIVPVYPELLSIYADRGNVRVLEQRLRWRGIPVEVAPLALGDALDAAAVDDDVRVAVVTGAASGIGRALAGRLTVEGMHVVLADVEDGALRDAVAGIGGDAVAFTTDVTSAAAVEALASTLVPQPETMAA